MKQKRRKWWKVCLVMLIALAIIPVTAFGASTYMVKATEDRIIDRITNREDTVNKSIIDQLKEKKADCILVLGAQVKPDGTPSAMLRDRLDVGIALYHKGAAPKLLLSGDNGQVSYDEVNVMKQYAMERGVPKEDIFLDHAGFSTYESAYRAKTIFQVNCAIVVTQEYHQYRALYGCKKMGIEAFGITSDQARYSGQEMRDLREVAGRDKDLIKWFIRPEPTYLGDAVPISGSGIKSQD